MNKKKNRSPFEKQMLHPIIQKAYQSRLKEFNSKIIESSFAVRANLPKCFKDYTQLSYLRKSAFPHEKHISLTLLKSNIGQNSILNRTFLISSNGLEGTLRKDKRDFISLGRQQVNEQGERPNDIMMYPTDPSISRTHCKIFYREFYERLKVRDNRFSSIFMMTNPRLGRCSPGWNITSELLANVYSFLDDTEPLLRLSDNGTIFGTYVKVRQFDLLKHLRYLFTTGRLKVLDYILKTYLNCNINSTTDCDNSSNYDAFGNNIIKTSNLDFIMTIEEKEFYDNLRKFITRDTTSNSTPIFNQPLISSQILINKSLEPRPIDKQFFLQNNNILTEKSVYLFDTKAGMNILSIGGVEKLIQSLLDESSLNENHINLNQGIDIISFDKIIDEQIACNIKTNQNNSTISNNDSVYYKITKSRIDLTEILLQSELTEKDGSLDSKYSFLYLILTFGDPCGIMNRGQEIVLVAKKFRALTKLKSEFV